MNETFKDTWKSRSAFPRRNERVAYPRAAQHESRHAAILRPGAQICCPRVPCCYPSPIITASTSLDGRRSFTKKFIMLSDLIMRLQPRKKMPKTTVSESTHSTAICTARVTNSLRSSGSSTKDPPPAPPPPSLALTSSTSVPANCWLLLSKAPCANRVLLKIVAFMARCVRQSCRCSPDVLIARLLLLLACHAEKSPLEMN